MNGLALCAGYGGLDIGIDLALGGKLRTVCYVEREARAAETLVARMEDEALERAPIWDDLRTFDGRPWRGRVDILTAGYPCQPFSHAGKRLGTDDPRHLWPEVRRILGETAAPMAFFENVRGHVRNGLAEVLADLDADGFDAEWGVLGAGDVGAPHKRDRLWIFAFRQSMAYASSSRLPQPQRNADGERVEAFGPAPELRSTSLVGDQTWPPAPNDSDGWDCAETAAEPAVCGVANGSAEGVDNRERLRMLGNGVVPLAAAYAFRTLTARAGLRF